MIVPILMGVLMAFAILPMTAGKAYAESYKLYVGDTQVTSVNASDILGDGTASYNATSNTLTLDGATITMTGDVTLIESEIPDLTIEVKGENKLLGGLIGIESFRDFTITGDGSLEAEVSDFGIVSILGGVTIKDATVTATATGNGSTGIFASGGIRIEGNSKVQANGGEKAIYSVSNIITIGDGLAITEPVNGRISVDGQNIVNQKGQTATSVTIEPLVEYNLWVGGTQVTNANAGDVLKDGKVRFTPAEGDDPATLTLNGVEITTGNNIPISSSIPDLIIEVNGENKVSGGGTGIESTQNFTITGEGSLQAEGSSDGIYSSGGVTIKDATVTATGNDFQGICAGGEVKIEGSSKVQANGRTCAIYSSDEITLGDGLVVTAPEGGKVNIDGSSIVDQKGDIAISVTIEPLVEYNLWVGGTPVRSDNASNILGDGTVSYNATSKTLMLDNAEITGVYASSNIYSTIPDLTIEVNSENKLSGGDYGIRSINNNDFTITGDGRLQAKGSVNGIVSEDGGVTIKDATVTATGTDIVGIGIEAGGEIKIEGRSMAQAQGTVYAIYSHEKIILGGHAITEPEGVRVSDDGKYIVDQYGNKATSVTIERVVKMNGDGTEESPYQIKTYADLKEFASIVNGKHRYAPQNTAACAELENTIIAKNDPSDAEYASDWTPIGTSSDPYIGHFDGDNHFIKGLSNEEQTNVSNADYQGLFGCIGKQDDTVKGEVKNVGLEGGKIIGKSYVGGVVGYNIGGEITNCYNTGAVSGIGIDVGGVAGQNNGGTITNCYNTGAVSGNGYIGGVTGYSDSSGTITNCYNTGAVSGNGYVGGVVGYNIGGEITNCYNTGAVRGAGGIVGGVAGYNSSDITNCYNTGAVSGTWDTVGGVAGRNIGGEITNCYNTGAVSGTGSYVGGVAGSNNAIITNCYNTGAVSGNGYVGGVAGRNIGGEITNCYYDRAFNMFTKAVGDTGDTGNVKNVKGLTTSQMTGTEAIGKDNMAFEYTGSSPWHVKGNGLGQNGVYYWYYPHLKGFAYDSSTSAADWPAKVIFDVDWNESEPYTYNASDQKPTVTGITVSQKPVEVPEGKTAEYSRRIDEGWEALSSAPTDPGCYKMTIKDGGKVIDEIVFVILQNIDYTVNYYEQTGGNSAEWSTDTVIPIAAGTYKAVVTDTDGAVLEEKVFQIEPAPLTIKAKDQTYEYDGQPHGEGDPAYADPAVIAEKIEAKGLQGSDVITSLILDGAETEIGEYKDRITITGFAINGKPEAKDNYNVTLVAGTLTITKPQPKPEPQPESKVNKEAPKAMTAGKNALTIHWRKVSGAQGYDIFFSIC